jgi:hypothetical protein
VREMAKAIEIATRMAESAAKDSARISQSFIPKNPETEPNPTPLRAAQTHEGRQQQKHHRQIPDDVHTQMVWGS